MFCAPKTDWLHKAMSSGLRQEKFPTGDSCKGKRLETHGSVGDRAGDKQICEMKFNEKQSKDIEKGKPKLVLLAYEPSVTVSATDQ